MPLLEPKITNWPEELIDHVSPVTFIPTPDKVSLALKVRVPPVTVKLLPLNIAVVKTLPVLQSCCYLSLFWGLSTRSIK